MAWRKNDEPTCRCHQNPSIGALWIQDPVILGEPLIFKFVFLLWDFTRNEGDKLMKEVLNGGYNVHPVPPPNSEIKERIMKRYETKRIKIEKLLTLGYTTSGDP